MSALDPDVDFTSEDDFLHAFLGLVAGAEQLGTALDAAAPASLTAIEAQTQPDPLLDALLGLIALRQQVLDVAATWAVDDAPRPPKVEMPPPRNLLS